MVKVRKRKRSDEVDVENGGDQDGGNSSSNKSGYILLAAFAPIVIQVGILCALMFVLTYYYTQAHTCINNREIWCKDDWYCEKQTASTDKIYSKCYSSKDHLASCLFGPNSAAATKCIDYSKDGAACPCVIPAGSVKAKGTSCMAGCPSDLSKASKASVCCCEPGIKGCPNTTMPKECGGT